MGFSSAEMENTFTSFRIYIKELLATEDGRDSIQRDLNTSSRLTLKSIQFILLYCRILKMLIYTQSIANDDSVQSSTGQAMKYF